jgi:hypothetical protein
MRQVRVMICGSDEKAPDVRCGMNQGLLSGAKRTRTCAAKDFKKF